MAAGTRNFLRNNSGLLAVILAALLFRLVYLLLYQALPDWNQLTVDNYYHHNWAISIAGGNILGDTTYFRAPFYVYCLALLYHLFGISLWVGRIFGLVIGLASILMTYLIARRVFDHRTGLVAATIQALYPVSIYFELELLLDPLFMLLLQLTIHRFLVWWDTGGIGQSFLTGVFLGMAAITRPTALIFVPLLVLIVIATARVKGAWFKQSIPMVLGVALLVLPITLRNYVVARDPVLISSQGGINLYIGNNDAADGFSAVMTEPLGFNWRISQITHIAETEAGRKLKPGEVSSFWLKASLDWMLRNPGDFLKLYATKLYHNFANREISNNRDLGVFFHKIPLLRYNPLSLGVLLALSLTGLLFAYRHNQRAGFMAVIILTYVIVSALFFFSSRFRLPLLPMYIVLAAATLVWLSGRLMERPGSAIPPLLLAVAVGFISYYPAVSLPPGSPSQHRISAGIYHMANQDYTAALEAFRGARRLDATFPETNLNLGAAFLRLGRMDSALYYFEQEKTANPQRSKTYTNLASVYLLQGDYVRAREEIERALEGIPFDVVTNMLYLRILRADSSLSPAQLTAAARKAARNTHYSLYLVNEAAAILSEQSQYEAAQALLLEATATGPPAIETSDGAFDRLFADSLRIWRGEKGRAFHQLGYISGLSGRFEQAVEYSRRAIECDSGLVAAHINLISAYLSTGRPEKAREALNAALGRFPNNDYLRQLEANLK
ncbi:MAG: glycosyltransferase family 39 protein [Candidatus Zixiibacteriota bacterium]|nr:MAG: glycosyltransferase family 39 protein [candidate division Zixibacteria bacterium]